MATVINLPGSKYNNDADFAVLNINEGATIEFTEAVVKENDEKALVYAYVTKIEKLACYDDKTLTSETFTPRLCKFALLKKPVEVKDKKVEPTPGMLVALKAIGMMEGKPFAGKIDFQKNAGDVAWFVLGQNSMEDPTPLPEAMKELLIKNHVTIEPIEKLEQLEGKDLADPKAGNGFRKGGFSSQTEKQKLNDRMSFLSEQLDEGSALYQLAAKVGYSEVEQKQFVQATVIDLVSKLLG